MKSGTSISKFSTVGGPLAICHLNTFIHIKLVLENFWDAFLSTYSTSTSRDGRCRLNDLFFALFQFLSTRLMAVVVFRPPSIAPIPKATRAMAAAASSTTALNSVSGLRQHRKLPILLFDVMDTLVRDPFYEDIPAFFQFDFLSLIFFFFFYHRGKDDFFRRLILCLLSS